MSPAPGGLFIAFIHGKHYDGQELFEIDPHEGRSQVEFITYNENKFGEWLSYPLEPGHAKGGSGHPMRIQHEQLDTTLEKSANLIGKATTEFQASFDGVKVVPFNLFRTLRVKSVKTADGQNLSFIQEDKNDDAQFSVILPRPLCRRRKVHRHDGV